MRNERRRGLKKPVRTRQLLHAPSVIMVAITTVPVLIMWLRGEGNNDNSHSALIQSIVRALLFDGVFSVMLLIVFLCMCVALYCVVCDAVDDTNDSTFDYLWTRRRKRRRVRRRR